MQMSFISHGLREDKATDFTDKTDFYICVICVICGKEINKLKIDNHEQ